MVRLRILKAVGLFMVTTGVAAGCGDGSGAMGVNDGTGMPGAPLGPDVQTAFPIDRGDDPGTPGTN